MNNTLCIVAYQYSHTGTRQTQTLRTCWCLNLWCSDYTYVVIAFPDREFALHMFTVSVPKAAVYLFFFPVVFITAKGTYTGDKVIYSKCATVPSTLQYIQTLNRPMTRTGPS